jgi:hypothetical protein
MFQNLGLIEITVKDANPKLWAVAVVVAEATTVQTWQNILESKQSMPAEKKSWTSMTLTS